MKIKVKDMEAAVLEMNAAAALEYLNDLKQEGQAVPDRLIEKYRKKALDFKAEYERFQSMCRFENRAYEDGLTVIAGIDEAGRGPLAGPVVAAAVILPKDCFIEDLNDSKKLSPKKRDELFEKITASAVSYGIGISDEKCIDEINILNATKQAMRQAVEALDPVPQLLLIDAEHLDNMSIPQKSIIKGDSLSVSIAAASILAKVTRDRMMDQMDAIYPEYGFAKHKGYGTGEHISAIKKFGLCPIHRISFTRNFI